MIASPLATKPAAAAPAPAAEVPEWTRPNVWKRGQVGIGVGTKWSPLEFGPREVGTEFGRGRLTLVGTQGYDMFYEDQSDAIRAASYLSAGQQGAITLDRGNFIGFELRTVDVIGDGHSQLPNPRPVQYHFEDLAATPKGRRELERNLKLGDFDVVIDGRWVAIADAAGSVKILEALKYVDSITPKPEA